MNRVSHKVKPYGALFFKRLIKEDEGRIRKRANAFFLGSILNVVVSEFDCCH